MLTAWPVDSLVKVFPDDIPPRQRGKAIDVLAARGATESAQFAIRVDRDADKLEIVIAPPKSARGQCLEGISWRRVEFVPVHRPGWAIDPQDRLRAGPSFFPDPLLDEEAIAFMYAGNWGGNVAVVPAGMTIPIWLTLSIPSDTAPGRYTGSVLVKAGSNQLRLPLVVNVSPAIVPAERTLKLTHWFSAANIATAGRVAMWSEEHWRLLELWGRKLADHRSNVVLTQLTELLHLTAEPGWGSRIDFSRFDRWVETFIKVGAIGYIEGGHLAARQQGWESNFGLGAFMVHKADGSQASMEKWAVGDQASVAFVKELIAGLTVHLKERGWFDRYYQHLADEPLKANAASYKVLSDTVRQSSPELKRMDATMADASLAGTVNIWCPQSKEAEHDIKFFRKRQALGEEVWHYTCLAPNGSYPNRFLNQPLIATRALHWFNYTANLTGYLHWGWNMWSGFNTPIAPFCDMESRTVQGRHNLPGGDTHIMYPGPHGRPLDSIRHEMVLEGVQDYELLKVLDTAKPKQARKLGKAIVPSLTRYERDPKRFRAVRAELLAKVAAVQ